MRRSVNKSHWGEFPDLSDAKYEVEDVFSIYPPEKRLQIEMLRAPDEVELEETITVDNELVTKTVELMNHTERIKSMIDVYSDHLCYSRKQQKLPTITLSNETKACLEELDHTFSSPFNTRVDSDFTLGKPNRIARITNPVAMEAIGKALAGLLRVEGFDACTSGSMQMFKDAVEEFYKSLLEKVSHVQTSEGTDLNKQLDVDTLEKAYTAMTNSSFLGLHNYYKNEITNRNRQGIIEFIKVHLEYEKMVEDSEQIQKFKKEKNRLVNRGRTPSTSSSEDSFDIASFYKDSNTSYDTKNSDESMQASFY